MSNTRQISMIEAVREALDEEMARDERVFLIGEDIERGYGDGAFGATRGLVDKYGKKRVRATPISEHAIVGAACGAALAGLRPVAEIMFNDWITLAMEPIVNVAAKVKYMCNVPSCPVVVRTTTGCSGYSAATHSQNLESWFLKAPGLYVVEPSTSYDAKGLLKAAIRDDNPVVFFEPKLLYPVKGEVPSADEDYVVPLGKADVKREGGDLTLISLGSGISKCLKAADEFAKQGISAEVVDMRCLLPMDMETVRVSLEKTNKVLLLDEGSRTGGWAAEVAARIADEFFDLLDAPVVRVGAMDVPVPYAPVLVSAVFPSVATILEAAKRLIA
ncbi:MAG: alpha-ketoacid dehydrogenase subunit beta [Candidatus Ranarchaeia archaeon]